MSSVEEYSRLTMNLFSASQAVIAFLGCPQRLRGSQLLLSPGWGSTPTSGVWASQQEFGCCSLDPSITEGGRDGDEEEPL